MERELQPVVGLDLSLTSTGVAVITAGKPTEVARIKPGKPTGCERLAIILARVMTYALQAGLVVIEGPSYGSKGGHEHERGGLWWLIAHELWCESIPYMVAPPATIKKYATGKGNADKDAVLAAAIRRFPLVPVDGNDQADALWAAAVGFDAASGGPCVPLPALNRSAIAGLKLPAATVPPSACRLP